MTTTKTNLIEPSTATSMTLGQSGENVIVGADSINANILQDVGGNTTITSDGSGTVTASGLGSPQVLINTVTASSSASISFTSGIDSTYREYVFEWTNIKPATDDVNLQVQFSSDGGSSYGMTKTTTFLYTYNNEADNSASFSYQSARDLAESTDAQQIASLIGNGADECSSGTLKLSNPSSTTYVKNFYVLSNSYEGAAGGNYYIQNLPGGYVNSTSAINAVQFTMSSGNIASGKIKMYGIK